MKLVIIILNYKTFLDTERLVTHLLSEAFDSAKILIVDNKSPNESFAYLCKRFEGLNNVDVIQSPENGGFAKGNNYGLRYAEIYNPEFVCVINNDVYFSKSTIVNLIEDFRIIKYGAIAPIQYLPNKKPANFTNLDFPTFVSDLKSYLIHKKIPLIKYESNTGFSNLQRVGLIPGAFIFMNYHIAQMVDFFDESTFLFCEERFLARRLMDKGYKCYIDINTKYVHEHSKTISSEKTYIQQLLLIRESKIKYYKKYEPYIKVVIISIISILNIRFKQLCYKLFK